jgi:serine/threonine protein phosphatase PrpC
VKTSTEVYFSKLCPQQVGTQETGKLPSELAQYQDFELEEDDLVLVCSDGVTDNLYPDEILETINKKLNVEKNNLQEVCNKLLVQVKQTAFDNYCVTPYVEKVNEMSSSFITGGKLDDTSICLSKVLLNK